MSKLIKLSDGSQEMITNDVCSTDEVKIGTWIDGKHIYRKYVTGIKANNKNTNIFVSNEIEKIINVRGFLGIIMLPNPAVSGTYGSASVSVYAEPPYIIINTPDAGAYSGADIRLIVEYTKTTD